MEDKGRTLSSDFSFHDVDEERECTPIGHSELLAISFGLLSTQPGTIIRVTKNLCFCLRCHSIAKFNSKMVEWEIISTTSKMESVPVRTTSTTAFSISKDQLEDLLLLNFVFASPLCASSFSVTYDK
ncbi:DYW domain [Dillenia turbinata]|uniref:DYW domain n=1 Tax=Dillenia turbinata TaxID=194707 RepID=A0AAN8V8P8_9MAGN